MGFIAPKFFLPKTIATFWHRWLVVVLARSSSHEKVLKKLKHNREADFLKVDRIAKNHLRKIKNCNFLKHFQREDSVLGRTWKPFFQCLTCRCSFSGRELWQKSRWKAYISASAVPIELIENTAKQLPVVLQEFFNW